MNKQDYQLVSAVNPQPVFIDWPAQVGAFQILEVAGVGPFGKVFRARSANQDRSVAVRYLSGLGEANSKLLTRRFRDLVLVFCDIRHQNVLEIVDFGISEGVPYLVNEYIDGYSLDDWPKRPITLPEALPIARQIAEALDLIHSHGAVHGALTPGSVLIRPDASIAVGDLGIAPLLWLLAPESREKLMSGISLLSPEQRKGEPGTTRSDVWSYAAILYYLLTGQIPDDSGLSDFLPAPKSLVAGIPDLASDALMRALAVQPEIRPPAAGVLLRDVFASPDAERRRRPALLVHYRRRNAQEPVEKLESLEQNEVSEPEAIEEEESFTVLEEVVLSYRHPLLERLLQIACDVRTVLGESALSRLRLGDLGIAALALIVVGFALAKLFDGRKPVIPPATIPTITTVSSAGQWTMPGYDAARTSFTPASSGQLEGKVAWSVPLSTTVTAGPSVGPAGITLGLADGRLVALDQATGALKWERKSVGPISGIPSQADGMVYLGTQDGRILALDGANGGTRWEFRTGGPVSSSPVAVDGILYAGSNDGRLYSLDAATGALRWEYEAGSPVHTAPSLSGGLVLVMSWDGRLHIVDASTGASRWVYRAGGTSDAPVSMAGGLAYLATDKGMVQALDPTAKGGPFEWEIKQIHAQLFLMGLPIGPPGTQPGFRWSFNAELPVLANLSVGASQLYIAGTDGRLQAIDALTGRPHWTFKFGGPIVGGPIVVGDYLYVGAEDGKFVVLDAAGGQKLWETSLSGRIRTSPAVGRGMVYVVTEEGKLFAIK